MDLKAIAHGHIKEMTGQGQDLYELRIRICEKCPLYSTTALGPMCSQYLWMDPANNDVSNKYKPGYIRGCGCRLKAKLRLKNQICVAGKW